MHYIGKSNAKHINKYECDNTHPITSDLVGVQAGECIYSVFIDINIA